MMKIIVSKSVLTTMVATLVIALLAINWTVINITAQTSMNAALRMEGVSTTVLMR